MPAARSLERSEGVLRIVRLPTGMRMTLGAWPADRSWRTMQESADDLVPDRDGEPPERDP